MFCRIVRIMAPSRNSTILTNRSCGCPLRIKQSWEGDDSRAKLLACTNQAKNILTRSGSRGTAPKCVLCNWACYPIKKLGGSHIARSSIRSKNKSEASEEDSSIRTTLTFASHLMGSSVVTNELRLQRFLGTIRPWSQGGSDDNYEHC